MEGNHLLVKIKIVFICIDKTFRKLFTVYVRPKLEYALRFCSPHLMGHSDLLRGEVGSHGITNIERKEKKGRHDKNTSF